jgi:hypothetical protein
MFRRLMDCLSSFLSLSTTKAAVASRKLRLGAGIYAFKVENTWHWNPILVLKY